MKLAKRRMTARSLGGVLATRQGSLLLALLCAGLAAVVLFVGLGHIKNNVSTPVPQATVLVATGEIESGMTGVQVAAQHLYKSTPVIASQISPGAFSDASQIADQTVSNNVLPGQQLTASDFGTVADVDQALGPNQRGLEVTISESPGAVDITQPDSRVDVYATDGAPIPTASTDGSSSSAAGSALTSPSSGAAAAGPVLIASNVRVLKPATAIPVTIGNTSVTGSSLVLALPDHVVKDVIAASGDLYLALRPAAPGKNPTTVKGGSK